jgi:ABC-type bacteriocin/lantibiotic exporter with double-glycine peptidase domain
MFHKFEQKNEDTLNKDLRLKKRMHISSFFDGNISFLAEIVVILFGASKIINGEITLGWEQSRHGHPFENVLLLI